MSIFDVIGNTPVVEMINLNGNPRVRIFGKLEGNNPGGSVKDRPAYYMIGKAEESGELVRGKIIIEPTSGNMGIALAMIGAAKGYRVKLYMPECVSVERQHILTAFGAEIVLTPAREGIDGSIRAAHKAMSEEPEKHYMPNQFANPANTLAHLKTTAQEIWDGTEGQVDAFVAGVGTSGIAMGVSRGLKERNPDVKIHVVEPADSAVISGETSGYHRIQGIGEGFVPDLLKHEHYDNIIKVSDEEAKATACRLARVEGIFAGYSAGANVFASLKVSSGLEEDQTVVTIIPDSGMKYLSTELFHHSPEICSIHCCTIEDPKRREECIKGTPSCCILEPC